MKRYAIASLLLLAGCYPTRTFPYIGIVDQRTFAPDSFKPETHAVQGLPERPLADIRFDDPDVNFDPDIATAVDLALSRKPDASFDVVVPIGRGKVPGEQAEQDAAAVARSIASHGIQPDHIHIGTLEDTGNPPREVRVYVR